MIFTWETYSDRLSAEPKNNLGLGVCYNRCEDLSMNIRKITTILCYLSEQLGGITKLQAAKLLYFIDKQHLIKYGRFVTNDIYLKYQYGPVPTKVLDIINSYDDVLFDEEKKYFLDHLAIDDGSKRGMRNKKLPDLDELSISEQETIDEVIAVYGKMSVSALVDISHEEKAWKNAEDYDMLNIEDIADELPADKKKELLSRLQQDKEINQFLRLLCA
ncbi:hypothetical protein NO2_1200 [Candidatus Termititenax persephonae]|uniref:Antitoxin SocA-like Panacea domain-containing protein n=1 Tax=Candidatus Termititenax persephonae TaxID=2218525 RepID=A0A388THQ2_9BACT|nr:hypothetical protein NO2_1200 [Candidatus Termititenax persephonae]